APTYLDLYRKFGFELDALAEQCRAFLDSTERLYEESADRLFRDRVGIGLAEIKRWDVGRVFRATSWDEAFPKEQMLPALEATLSDLGIDLRSQENVHLDIEERPRKTPRAFCAPIEVPGRVMLVIQPIGGPDDWRALFHEAGHTEHFAHTSADLAVEDRRLGPEDRAEPGRLSLRPRSRLQRHRLPPRVGLRGADADLPAREVRAHLVRRSHRGLAPARAVGRGPADDGRRDAPRGDRCRGRDGVGRGHHPRDALIAVSSLAVILTTA